MSNKLTRTKKEYDSLFSDPKFARNAWKSIGIAIASQPASKPIESYNKDGEQTVDSMIQSYSYEKLMKDLGELGKPEREPTELEMILHCQMIKARTDTSAAVFIRDTLGAKPVDESKLDANITNPYENLTDEELEMIAKLREQKVMEANREQLVENCEEEEPCEK